MIDMPYWMLGILLFNVVLLTLLGIQTVRVLYLRKKAARTKELREFSKRGRHD